MLEYTVYPYHMDHMYGPYHIIWKTDVNIVSKTKKYNMVQSFDIPYGPYAMIPQSIKAVANVSQF